MLSDIAHVIHETFDFTPQQVRAIRRKIWQCPDCERWSARTVSQCAYCGYDSHEGPSITVS